MSFQYDRHLVVPIKGELPARSYRSSLRDHWERLANKAAILPFTEMDVKLAECRDLLNTRSTTTCLSAQVGQTESHTHLGLDRPTPIAEIVSALPEPRPYSFEMGPEGVLFQALAWADSNIKILVERLVRLLELPSDLAENIVETIFDVFASVLQHGNAVLSHRLGFNSSAFLQEHLISLAAGEAIDLLYADREETGTFANNLVTDAIQQMSPSSLEDQMAISLVAGASWNVKSVMSHVERQQTVTNLAKTLSVDAARIKWGTDYRFQFLKQVRSKDKRSVVYFFDDNGEAAADLSLLQSLIRSNSNLEVTLVVNRLPISVNASEATIRSMFRHPFFSDMNEFQASGKVRLLTETQHFGALEPRFFMPATVRAMNKSDFLFLKGVQLFEIFGPEVHNNRIHAFVVYGHSSEFVAGWPAATAVFANTPRGHQGYEIVARDSVRNLRQLSSHG